MAGLFGKSQKIAFVYLKGSAFKLPFSRRSQVEILNLPQYVTHEAKRRRLLKPVDLLNIFQGLHLGRESCGVRNRFGGESFQVDRFHSIVFI